MTELQGIARVCLSTRIVDGFLLVRKVLGRKRVGSVRSKVFGLFSTGKATTFLAPEAG